MGTYFWIKLYLDLLDNPRLGQLPDHLWRRLVELYLLAGLQGEAGALPPVEDMAWKLHLSSDQLVEDLRSLAQTGELRAESGGLQPTERSAAGTLPAAEPDKWFVTNFAARQANPSTERTRAFRQRSAAAAQKNNEKNAAGTDASVPASISPSISNSASDSDPGSEQPLQTASEPPSAGEAPPAPLLPELDRLPTSPAEAMLHPDVQIFTRVTGGRIPGLSQYRTVIETVRFLRQRQELPDAALADWLSPYWLAWSSRKRLDGRPYDPANLTWLTEWALNTAIPPVTGLRQDGPRPPGVLSPQETRRMLAEKEQQRRLAVPPPEELRARMRGLKSRLEGKHDDPIEKVAETVPGHASPPGPDRGPGPPA